MDVTRLPVGYILGERYTIVSVIGIGGMSVVYGAYDIKTGETVAVKMLDLSSCATEEAKAEAEKRFVSEANIMSKLSHPNIVNICGTSGEGEPPYVVMEYVEANTLKRRIEDCGALTLRKLYIILNRYLKLLYTLTREASCIAT